MDGGALGSHASILAAPAAPTRSAMRTTDIEETTDPNGLHWPAAAREDSRARGEGRDMGRGAA
jgi:hypothetical protein